MDNFVTLLPQGAMLLMILLIAVIAFVPAFFSNGSCPKCQTPLIIQKKDGVKALVCASCNYSLSKS